ncbi:MAG: iron permease [Symbiobacteriaceae bacterium]|jgi:high-affinity iron transporter|nr:iron permease [Symbiobacteriaceae bacterium]
MFRRVWIALLVVAVAAGLLPVGVRAGADPAVVAEQVRTALLRAQVELEAGTPDPAAAAAALEEARRAYEAGLAESLAAGAPAADAGVRAGLAAAGEAVAGAGGAGAGAALAGARAQVWTGLLDGAYQLASAAIERGNGEAARTWLRLREFRAPTRFSRPSADATRAVERFAAGQVDGPTALVSLRADLLDTYQERLRLSLLELQVAQEKGFTARAAEHGALAAGYFAMLAPAYAEQRGADALRAAEAALGALRTAALAGRPTGAELEKVEEALHGFRAAPLSPEEQARRAGQFRRFLGLVPVEYARGVSGGKVTKEFEIHEAITFQEGAEAAFADLQTLLEQRDATATNGAAAKLSALGHHLHDAAAGKAVASPTVIEALVKEIDGLITPAMPEAWTKRSTAGDFDAVDQLLDQMERAVAAGQYELAESARLEAYAVLETGPEPRLVAFAPQFIPSIENLFWHGSAGAEGLARLIQQKAPLADVKSARAQLDTQLAAASDALAGGDSPVAVGTNAGLIVFREGLEAVLILASLMAGFQRAELRRLRRPLWWGAGASLIATVLTWLLARGVLASLARYGEKLEAIVSVIAVGVLLLITNWFFHKSYWTDWLASFHAKKKGLVSGEVGQWIGLATLGFTSIYREGFETVLFLQALVLDVGNGPVLGGVALGMVGVVLIGFLLFRLQVKLPYKKMLIVTGIFIGSVLLTMVGKLVHSFQVVGWLPTHPIRSVSLPYWFGDWFGIFATVEGIILQIVCGVFVIGSYYLAEWMQHREAAAGASVAHVQSHESRRPDAG